MLRPLDEQTLDFMPPIFGWATSPELQHAGKDDDEDDDDDLEDDDEDADEDAEDDDERTPEELRADLAKAAARLKRVNAEAKRHRLRAREAREKTPKPKAAEAGDDDVDARVAAARAEVETKANARIKATEGRAALRAAGVSDERIKRAVGLLGLDDLDVDDEGVIGLDDAVEELRADFPELFDKPRRRRRSGAEGTDRGSAERSTGPKTEKTASQRQAEAMLGGKS